MSTKSYFYLIKLQFIGFRFSGWQKQDNAKTIQEMVERTISFILGHQNFRTLGVGRTDAKVSANEFAFELFINELLETEDFLDKLNISLPPDIRALEVKEVDKNFNIINDSKIKEYFYIFTSNERPHPFSAPFMVYFPKNLDINIMKKGAKLFEGDHNFKSYCYRPSEDTEVIRKIDSCEIIENELFTANFFPDNSWILKVCGKGFMRHQIRLMMGTLVNLGRQEITLIDIEKSLEGSEIKNLSFIAPSSGLMLNRVYFN